MTARIAIALLALSVGVGEARGDARAQMVRALKAPGPVLSAGDASAHVWFDGAQLRDKKGNAWTMTGTVPQIPTKPKGAGPFTSATNFYSAGDAFDQAGSWSACILLTQTDVSDGIDGYPLAKDSATGRSFTLYVGGAATQIAIYGQAGGSSVVNSAGAAAMGTHVVCFSYAFVADNTSVLRLMVDGVFTGITNARGPMLNSTTPFEIGQRAYAANESAFKGYVHEVVIWSRALSDAEMTAHYTRARAAGF